MSEDQLDPIAQLKPPISGGHKDANRSLVDKGKEPIYEDKDEEHHKGKEQDKADEIS